MRVVVNKQSQRFFIPTDRWQPVIGHGLEVGKYLFCVIPIKGNLNIYEVTSGMKISSLPLTNDIKDATESKEEAMHFLHRLGERLASRIEGIENFDKWVKEYRASAIKELGDRPPIKDVDMGAENHT